MVLAAGHQLGRYEIVAPLGAGGMGEVYRARDHRLDREVAIKVLPSEVATDRERLERFEREAKATATLAHPNIVQIHDFDTHDGVSFAVMELLEGDTLRAVMASGRLAESDAIELAGQVADGLAAAHERGVVHRDIKPENLIVTAHGRIKILDFGLARLCPAGPVSDEGAEARTELMLSSPGVVMGTVGYMAPEQLRGEPADHRSDIFSLGCVLYEILAGRRAFTGSTAPEVAGAVLHGEVQSLEDVRPEIARVVERCLATRPNDRYQSARELGRALQNAGRGVTATRDGGGGRRLRLGHALAILAAVMCGAVFVLPPEGIWQRWNGSADGAKIRSLAVLPLDNLSGDADEEYFADGMTDELIMNLAKIESLDVISRTSAMRYKGSDEPLPEIARELGVDAIIEGTVLRSDEVVRISVQLIDGKTDRRIWAESYRRPLHDVLLLQSEVARDVAHRIDITLSPTDEQRLARAETVNPEAHQEYLLGLHHFLRFSAADSWKAIEHFERAISIDPEYADAHAWLSAVHLNSAYFLSLPPEETVSAARREAGRALELDPDNVGALVSEAWISMTYDWDWQASEQRYRRALELNPGSEAALNNYAFLLACLGRSEEALAHVDRARELDPLSLVINQNAGWLLYNVRRTEEAVSQLERTIELDPNFWFAYQRLGHALLALGNYERGIEVTRRAIDLAGPQTIRNGRPLLAQLLAAAGRREEALEILGELEEVERTHYLPPTDIARVHAALGQSDEAFRRLDQAVEVHDADLFMTGVWPAWDPIRDDPRFDVLLQRLHLPVD